MNRPKTDRRFAAGLLAALTVCAVATASIAQEGAGDGDGATAAGADTTASEAKAGDAKKDGADSKAKIISSRTLDNGLEVIVIEDHAVPLVTIEVAVRNGAFTEPPKFNGLSHLYEHMFFKGNAVIPDQEAYLNRMRELGIVFNGTTSAERVNYFFTLPASNLTPGLEFMYNAITSPKFDEKEFQKEIKVVLGEVDRNESSPYYWFSRAMDELLWYKYSSRKDSLGDRETITSATTDMMRTMKERYYVPNNSALLISGDVTPEKAFALAEKQFSGWKRGPDPFEKNPVPEHPPLQEPKATIVTHKDARVPVIQFGWHGPSVDEDPGATYAADVLSFILSQPTSKFQKNLVESGIALGAGLSYYTQAHTGPISASVQCMPDKVRPATAALIQEVYKLADPDYFTDEQLASAKTILAVQDVYARERASSLTHTVSFWWAVDDLDYYIHYVDNLKKVTRQDIASYVQKYIIGKPFALGLLSPPKMAEQLGLDETKLEEIAAEAILERGEGEGAGEEGGEDEGATDEDAGDEEA